MKPRTVSLLIAISAAGCFAAEPAAHLDLAYTPENRPLQRLDVYSPPGTGHPVVLWIHGGGWTYGDKSNLQQGSTDTINHKPVAFTQRGYVLVAVNYRLFPQVNIGEMAGDIGKAIGWVHAHIAEYGGDPNKLFVSGHSAGAQLAALVCTDATYVHDAGLQLSDVKGCAPFDGDMYYPPLRLDSSVELAEVKSSRAKFPDAASEKEYSAIVHIWPGKRLPPFLIFYIGGHPESGTKIQSEVLADAIQVSGGRADLVVCPGKTHNTLNADLGLPGDMPTQRLFDFLDAQLVKTDLGPK
jgi:arylformamidase